MPFPLAMVAAIVAAIAGAFLATESRALFGAIAGATLAALFASQRRLAQRLAALEARPAPSAAPGAAPVAGADPAPAGPTASPSPAAATPPPLPDLPPAASTPASRTAVPGRAGPGVAQAPTPAPAGATPAAAPSPLETALGALRRFLFEGNVPVKLGLVVSLFGIGALLRYAASTGWLEVPVALRYAGVAAAGLALLGYGLRQAGHRPAFGLSLQGGGIAVLLLTVFAAFRVPGLLPAPVAFTLVVVLVAGAAVLALRQNAVWLAAIGLLGGYLAPVLLSTGGGSHVALFSWYAVLNLAVFGLAWVRPWRALNLLGFAFTFGIGAAWGARHFRPELFASTEPFLVGFFLLYVAIPVLYALRGREPGKVDATLLFGTPLLAFPMQVALLEGERLPLAFSALGVGLVYAAVAWLARRRPALRVLGQGAAALGLAFATLAVPLALSAQWTAVTWALQGVALLWLGQVQQRRWPRVGGVLLQGLAGLAFLASDPWSWFGPGGDARPSLPLALLALAAAACARLLDRQQGSSRGLTGGLLTAVALGWWALLGIDLADLGVEHGMATGTWEERLAGMAALWLGFIAASSALAALALRRLPWQRPAWWPALFVPTALPALGLAFSLQPGWWRSPVGLVLPVFASGLLLALPALRQTPRRLALTHLAGLAALVLALGLAIREGLQALNPEPLGEGWHWVLPWLPLVALTTLLATHPARATWPVAEAAARYRPLALWLAGLLLGTVWWATQGLAGSAAPLPWLPLLNPLELFHLAGLLGLLAALRRARPGSPPRQAGILLLGGAAFVFLSMAALRGTWHALSPEAMLWAYHWPSVLRWPQAQTALSVVWSLAGVTCWVLGSRRGSRPLWTAGALLLGLVLLKLVAIDRQHLGDLMGIVSFLAVGGLLVLVGRLAPRPPRHAPPSTDLP